MSINDLMVFRWIMVVGKFKAVRGFRGVLILIFPTIRLFYIINLSFDVLEDFVLEGGHTALESVHAGEGLEEQVGFQELPFSDTFCLFYIIKGVAQENPPAVGFLPVKFAIFTLDHKGLQSEIF
jgi:hypothetical protein